ncbi:MAG: hypothetical protein D6790_14585 [Caldilineae bacterium]|nr:MAG: hypothetical protein D6790_14585 [Caldilineae bacterium]
MPHVSFQMNNRTFFSFLMLAALLLACLVSTAQPLAAEERAPASIHGEVFLDANISGAREPQEQGVALAVVLLYDSQAQFVGRTLTDREGYYTFQGLEMDRYTLRVVPPRGMIVLRNGLVTLHPGEVQGSQLVSTSMRYGLYIPVVVAH